MKVLYVAAECKPFSKAGGVGDVAGELPPALRRLGVDVQIVTPWYGAPPPPDYTVRFDGRDERVGIVRTELQGVPVHFVRHPAYFEIDWSRRRDRPQRADRLFRLDYSAPYVDSGRTAFIDDAFRFSFFSEACVPLIRRLEPDIVHVNDWVLGFLLGRMALEKMAPRRVLTIHNIGYQGNLGRDNIRGWTIESIARDPELGPCFADPRPEWNSVNPLRLAMELAAATNTVSPTYKEEITRPENPRRWFEGGKGLDTVAARLDAAGSLHGILNGFDYGFAPTDERFAAVLAEKAEARRALARHFPRPDDFLLGFVGRAVEQKFRLLVERLADGRSVLEHLLDLPGVNVAVLATGLPRYERFLRGLEGRPNLSVTVRFDREKARQISLGSDVFLMPSLFEPCGITQMESLSLATPPLVRWTGGLVDTVRPHTDPRGTGFGFDGRTRREVLAELIATVVEAQRVWRAEPGRFRELQRRGFAERFLWSAAAERTIELLYEPALALEPSARA